MQARAFSRNQPVGELLCIAVTLRDGTEVLLDEGLPGFGHFLTAAEAALPGMRKRAMWTAGAHPAIAQRGTVIFDRDAPKA